MTRLLVPSFVLVVGCAHRPPDGEQATAPRSTRDAAQGEVNVVDAAGRVLDFDELVSELARAPYVLLGERHDNPEHHALQARIFDALVQRGRRLGLVFEMLTRDDQPSIDAFLGSGPVDATELGPRVGFEQRGWPAWSLYAPIADVAVRAGLPIVGGDLSESALTKLRQQGFASLTEAERAPLGLPHAFPDELRDEIAKELVVAHCGHGTPAAMGPMAGVQFARDAALASALEDAALRRDGAVLIAGAGHARVDRGAPWHLRRLRANEGARRGEPALAASQLPLSLSVAFVEVEEGMDGGADDPAEGPLPYDFVIFTKPVEREDPCEVFRKKGR